MSNIFKGYLLACDMDGTLLNSKKEISKGNKDAIDYFVNNGGRFTLATGRMIPSVKAYADKINMNMPAILHNGAKLYDYTLEKVVDEHSIEENRKSVIKKVNKDRPYIGIEVYCDEVVYIYQSCEETKRFNKYKYDVVYNMPDEVWNKKWTKVLLIGTESEIDSLEKEFKNKYDDGNVVRSGEHYLDIIPNNISKARSVLELADRYNLPREKTIAVGDNINDIEMLQSVEYGFCTENGAKRAVENAKYHTTSNDKDAVKYVIQWIEDKIMKNKEEK